MSVTGALWAAGLAALAAFTWLVVRYSGAWLAACPERGLRAALWLDWPRRLRGRPLGVARCTAWDGPSRCTQACLRDRTVLVHVHEVFVAWFRSRPCADCGRSLRHLRWWQAEPVLRHADGGLGDWSQAAPLEVPRLLAQSAPLCWDCYLQQARQRP